MRPTILNPLFAALPSLKGVGPKLAPRLEQLLGGGRVVDLLWHLPRDLIDRSYRPKVMEAEPGRIATIKVMVDRHEAPNDRKRPYRIRCFDDTGFLTLIYFHADPNWLERLAPEGTEVWVSGKPERFQGQMQMPHPDHVVPVDQVDSLPLVEPVYPMTAGVSPKVLAGLVERALAQLPELPEWQDGPLMARQAWPGFGQALRAAHHPAAPRDMDPAHPGRERLAYDELLATQLAIALVRRTARIAKGRAISGNGTLRRKALAALPFKFTASQNQALTEIGADMAASDRMLRLLQGDVGSGKTVVALFAMLNAVECGGQAALMAPTEILARQHFETMQPICEAAGVKLAVLTGRDKGATRKSVLDGLASGAIDLAVGTHALFQEDVAFRDLMLAVVDEQHRFGVHQRLMLSGKGQAVDLLVMTATPIPRTLMLSAYGDLDVSRLTDKPPGRKPIDTRAVPNARIEDVIGGVSRAMAQGAQVYWVCPLVEESEVLDLAAAEDRYAELSEIFGPDRVALVHGRMKPAAKDTAMARFAEGEARLLVATTVIEVGVNVPNATVMVIEHAERFGLAQLHQLRGRIGRGEKPSTCILLYGGRLSDAAEARLKTIRETEDGFRIAEEDLKLRGAGELLGTRQSGLPQFRLASIEQHGDLMEMARDDAAAILARDPDLAGERGKALITLLYLFDRDSAVKTLRSG